MWRCRLGESTLGEQARSDATRQAIVNAAVDLFAEVGYGNTALSHVIARARVTKGAFYYHFATKEALAKAVIEQAYSGLQSALPEMSGGDGRNGAALERLIRASFAIADLAQRDKKIRTGIQMSHALEQINGEARTTFGITRELFAVLVKAAAAEGDLAEDVDSVGVGHVLRSALSGNYLMARATGENIAIGMARLWRLILRGNVSPAAALFFQQLVDRTEAQYCRTC
jgi:AcrR family transcriptional regulator